MTNITDSEWKKSTIMKTRRHARLAILASVVVVLLATGVIVALSAGRNEEVPLYHCGEHYLGENLRQPTPPLHMREWNEVDRDFLDNFGARWGTTFAEHGDMSDPFPFLERWWGYDQLQDHTMLLWSEEELFDFRLVALGFTDTGDEMSFYVRHELDISHWVAPYSLIMVNATLHHYLIPRMGITFTDSRGVHHRLLIQESMQGGCYPLFNLAVFDDSHFATWDDSIPPQPIVMIEMGAYLVNGLGGHRISIDPRQRSMHFPGGTNSEYRAGDIRQSSIFFAGSGFDVYGLHGEHLEGSAHFTQDGISVAFAVARNQIIMELTDGPLGTLAGPGVSFEYVPGLGSTTEIYYYPFEFWEGNHPPLEFYMPEEGAIQLARLLLQAVELVEEHRAFFS